MQVNSNMQIYIIKHRVWSEKKNKQVHNFFEQWMLPELYKEIYIFFRLVVATVNASHLNMGEWFLKDLQITLFY